MCDERSRSSLLRQELLAIGALLFLLALRFWPTIASGHLYAPFNDNVFIYGPMFSETARIALHGEIPFYLPSFGTGFPLYQSPHYSPFYPFYFFGLIDYGGPLQSLYTLNYLTVFHRFILALNFYVMLRAVRGSPWPAFVGATLGTVAYNTEVYSGWITIAASYTWLPLMVAAGILLLRGVHTILATLLLGVSAGLLCLASSSQSVVHALFFGVVLFGAGAIWLYQTRGIGQVWRLLGSLSIAGAIAIGIAAVSLIPVFLGIDGMIRHIGTGYVVGHQPIPWDKFNLQQLSLGELSAILIKPGSVEIVGSPYIGPLGLVGVGLVFIFWRRLSSFERLVVATVGGIGLYGLFSACGTNLGFAYLNYHLPLINKVREAGRHLVLFVIAIGLLSGIGLDQLSKAWKKSSSSLLRDKATGFGVLALLLAFVFLAGWELWLYRRHLPGEAIILFLIPAIVISGAFLRIEQFWFHVALVAIASVAAVISPVRTFAPASSDYYHRDNIQSLEILSAIRGKIGSSEFRIDFVDKKLSPFTWGMNASYFGFKSFYNRLTPQPYDQFRFSWQHNPPLLREIMGARYVLCGPKQRPDDPTAVARFDVDDYTVFENSSYMSRLTLLHSLAGTYKDQAGFIGWARRRFDFNHGVFLRAGDAARLKPFLSSSESSDTGDMLYRKEDKMNKVTAQVQASRPGLVVLNEWFTQAWKAKVNGASQPTVRANFWQVGVPVQKGESTVEFLYRPSLCSALLILNRLTWLLLGLFVIGHLIYRLLRTYRPDFARVFLSTLNSKP
jgi:hypothetical protein